MDNSDYYRAKSQHSETYDMPTETVRDLVWPDPTEEMLSSPRFEAIWRVIKEWDINVPRAYSGYSGATGNHVRAIMDALETAGE